MKITNFYVNYCKLPFGNSVLNKEKWKCILNKLIFWNILLNTTVSKPYVVYKGIINIPKANYDNVTLPVDCFPMYPVLFHVHREYMNVTYF